MFSMVTSHFILSGCLALVADASLSSCSHSDGRSRPTAERGAGEETSQEHRRLRARGPARSLQRCHQKPGRQRSAPGNPSAGWQYGALQQVRERLLGLLTRY